MKHNIAIFSSVFFLLVFFGPLNTSAVTRSLSLGLSGTDVTAMQKLLITNGYLTTGKDTGYFGALTQSALQKFQCDQKIACGGASGYGIYGPKTQVALIGPVLSPANTATLSGSLTPTATGSFEFSGWIPYWRSATGTVDTLPHLSSLKSIMPFGYTIKSNGTLADTAKITEEPWVSFIAAAKKAKVRVVPTVMWGDGDTIQKILSNTATRVALENEIANMVKQNGFDGVDIDFEAKQHETVVYFSTFLKGLYQRLNGKWVYCTIEARMPLQDRFSPGATIPANTTDFANDYVEMNKYCDRVEIMAYDQGTIDVRLNASRSAPYAPVADPGWVEDVVRLAAQTISRNKLIIGIPTYGYEYTVTPTSGNNYKYDRLWAFNLKYATDIASKLGITPTRTSANEIGLVYDPSKLATIAPTGSESTQTQQTTTATTVTQNAGSQVNTSQPFNYMTWSDAQAIADKIALAKKLGVRGVAFFKFDGGEDQGLWGLFK